MLNDEIEKKTILKKSNVELSDNEGKK